MDFVLCEGSRGVLQVIDLPIFIMWTWLRVAGLRMVSMVPHLDCSHQNISPKMYQIDLSKELRLVNIY